MSGSGARAVGATGTVGRNLPAQVTTFVGRAAEITALHRALSDNRLVTLTGAGGAGKTRLALQLASQLTAEFCDGVWFVDLAPVTDPARVPDAVVGTLGVPDSPAISTADTLIRFIGNRRMLLLLDNCEHLLDAVADLAASGLRSCPSLTVLATSREPMGVSGEVAWRVPPLSLTDEAIELFTERARRLRPGFTVTEDNVEAVTEICRHLDGMPLAIELAAARVRSATPAEICADLHDSFRLLASRSRAVTARQRTLRASVDWSHSLLTEAERIVFRRVAVFRGGYYRDAAAAIVDLEVDLESELESDLASDLESNVVRDLLTSLADKSLVIAEDAGARTRYRLLETMRQYALEKLVESGEDDEIRSRHCDYYAGMTVALDGAVQTDHSGLVDAADEEIDNLRAAFDWSREKNDTATALRLASALQPVWLGRGRTREGRAWFDALLADARALGPRLCPPPLRARALADRIILDDLVGVATRSAEADEATAIARGVDDPELLAWTLAAQGVSHAYDLESDGSVLDEAIELARSQSCRWRPIMMLCMRAHLAYVAGEPIEAKQAAAEGLGLADAIGDRYGSRACRWAQGMGQMMEGDLAGAVAQFSRLLTEADGARDLLWTGGSLVCLSRLLTQLGEYDSAKEMATAAIGISADLGGFYPAFASVALAVAHLSAGDVASASAASRNWQDAAAVAPRTGSIHIALIAQIALAQGDLVAARRWADDAVAATRGWHAVVALTTRARIAIAQGEQGQAESDVHGALAWAAKVQAWTGAPDALECLALLAGSVDPSRATRLLGAADSRRRHTGEARPHDCHPAYDALVIDLRNMLGEKNFNAAWTEGAELSVQDAIAYAQRGRGSRKRPTTGWESLTPAERQVVELAAEGLPNKDIAARLFVSVRTVKTHLGHAYTKLDLASRVQLAGEVARHV